MRSSWPMLFLLFSLSGTAQVVLNEVMFNPSGPESTDEFVELYNAGESPIDLSGWKIGDGVGEDRIQDTGGGTVLQPRQYGLVLDPDYFEKSTSYDALIPDTCLVLTIDGSTFGSSGFSNSQPETITLLDPSGRIVDTHTYDITIPAGYSSERILIRGPEDPWGPSRVLHGTPGTPNSIRRVPVDLAVFDVRYADVPEPCLKAGITNAGLEPVWDAFIHFFHDADGDGRFGDAECLAPPVDVPNLSPGDSLWLLKPWTDPPPGFQTVSAHLESKGDGRPDNDRFVATVVIPFPERTMVFNEILFAPPQGGCEWVELLNRSTRPIDLKGWRFSDANRSKRILLSEKEAILDPSAYAVMAGDVNLKGLLPVGTLFLVLSPFPTLNDPGDSLFLYDPSGRVIDSVFYRGEWLFAKGISLERLHPDRPSQDPRNWYGSTAPEGMTPGQKNSVFQDMEGFAMGLTVTPNPFSPDGDGHDDIVHIGYRFPEGLYRLHLRVFDVCGRVIKTLCAGLPTGREGSIVWDGRDEEGLPLPIGLYLIHLEARDISDGRRIEEKTVVVLAGRL